MFFFFKLCLNDGAIQQKRKGVQTELFEIIWKGKTGGVTEFGMEERYEGKK